MLRGKENSFSSEGWLREKPTPPKCAISKHQQRLWAAEDSGGLLGRAPCRCPKPALVGMGHPPSQ